MSDQQEELIIWTDQEVEDHIHIRNDLEDMIRVFEKAVETTPVINYKTLVLMTKFRAIIEKGKDAIDDIEDCLKKNDENKKLIAILKNREAQLKHQSEEN